MSLVFRRLPPGLPRQCYADWQAVAGGRAGVESVIVPQWSELEAGVRSANCDGRGNYAVMKSCKYSQNNVHKSNRWINDD